MHNAVPANARDCDVEEHSITTGMAVNTRLSMDTSKFCIVGTQGQITKVMSQNTPW